MAGVARWRRAKQLGLALAVGATVVASGSAGAAQAASTAVASIPLSPGHTLSGVDGIGGLSAVNGFSAWRGRPVQAVTTYLGNDTWASIDSISSWGLTQVWDRSTAHVVYSMPLLPLVQSASLQQAAAGAYNGNYSSVARQLVAGGDGSSTIRLGWEMTGNWYTWSGIKDPAAYAAAWRQAVTAMRSVPGANFTFDFNIALGGANPAPMYPGDGYVDLIGADVYDYTWAAAPGDHVKAWSSYLTEAYGLNWLTGFAAEHGKRMSFPEWGAQWTCDGHGGADDPYFVEQFLGWVAAHDVAYETYFDRDDNACTKSALRNGVFPKASAEYQKIQSSSASTVAITVTPPVSAPVRIPAALRVGALDLSRIQVSDSPLRSNGAWLFGHTVTGAVYIWLADSPGTTQVKFFVDRASTAAPTSTDSSAPWDLEGGSAAAAVPLAAGTLGAGTHQLTVVATTSAGTVQSATVSFTVR